MDCGCSSLSCLAVIRWRYRRQHNGKRFDTAQVVMTEPEKITYPCDYPIKVVGDVRPNLHEDVYQTVVKHDPTMTTARVSQKTSRKGNFISISFLLTAESESQIKALFADLKQIDAVRLVL